MGGDGLLWKVDASSALGPADSKPSEATVDAGQTCAVGSGIGRLARQVHLLPERFERAAERFATVEELYLGTRCRTVDWRQGVPVIITRRANDEARSRKVRVRAASGFLDLVAFIEDTADSARLEEQPDGPGVGRNYLVIGDVQ